MKCPVCNCSFEKHGDCPVCGFPEVESPDIDALMQYLQPQIREHRNRFLKRFRLSIQHYVWKEENGEVVLDRTELEGFGSADELCGKEVWLPRNYARDPSAETLTLQVKIENGDSCRMREVSLPNLSEAALQNIGVAVTEDLAFRLLLRNQSGGQSASEKIYLYENAS